MPEFSDETLLALAGRIAQYMGQEPWIAREHCNGAACADPKRPDFGFHVRNTWPRGRVALDGLYIRHRDGVYDRTWHYHKTEITVDPNRPPEKLAGDVKRRLLPALEARYAEICKEREEFKGTIIKCREVLAWLNGLRNTFDPSLDPWEERDVPYSGSHDKYLDVGLRQFKLHFSGCELQQVTVGADKAFFDGMIGLHLSTLPELWGWWRKWDIEENGPYRYWGHRRDDAGELRGNVQAELADLYRVLIEGHEDAYKLQFRQLGDEQWQDWSPVVEPSSAA